MVVSLPQVLVKMNELKPGDPINLSIVDSDTRFLVLEAPKKTEKDNEGIATLTGQIERLLKRLEEKLVKAEKTITIELPGGKQVDITKVEKSIKKRMT